MANDFLRLSCPYCGGSLCPDGELYRCGDCGNRFEKKKTETDSEKIRSILDEMKAEQVANIRRRLWEETHKEYISSDAILDAAQKILDILPEDRFANFYKAAVSEGYEELNRFLDNFDASNTDDLPLILDFSVKVMEELNINSVKALAERGLTGEAKIDYYSKIEAEAEKIQSGIYNTDVPRTVFLAYSSKDMKKVNEVAAYLESQGFSCFVALRNLRHGKGAKENYQAEIMNAIANCKCVVFISSENSRAMTCDAMRIEIPFLRKTYPDKPHIEFLIEDYGKKTSEVANEILKDYFRNLEYCTTLKDLGVRVLNAEADVNTGATAISKQQEEMMKKLEALEKKTEKQSTDNEMRERTSQREQELLKPQKHTSKGSVVAIVACFLIVAAVVILFATGVFGKNDLSDPSDPIITCSHSDAQKTERTDPTCTEDGKEAYWYCAACGKYFSDSTCQKVITGNISEFGILPAKHIFTNYVYQNDATCTQDGHEKATCEQCSATDERVKTDSRLGHSFTNYVYQNDATCTKNGNEKAICDRCSEINIQAKANTKLGHIVVVDEAVSATCQTLGLTEGSHCSRCSEVLVAQTELPIVSHEYVNDICKWCSQAKPLYTRINTSGTEDENGTRILFGSYPQSKVTDSALISTLNSKAGTLPTNGNDRNWTSYGYYQGTGITGSQSNSTDYMWYIDVTEGTERYRGVYFTSYRPVRTSVSSSSSHTYQDDNGYTTSQVYWFKYEPLKWRILTQSNGQAMLLCESIIDSQAYQNETVDIYIKNTSISANNYAESTIRKWLNETFYNTAFSEAEKTFICTTTVDNSARSTNPDNNANHWNSGTNAYACGNTSDKIFLLSEQEVTKGAYGFSTDYSEHDTARQLKTTDYAQSQGIHYYSTVWWLRSPNCEYKNHNYVVSSNGFAWTQFEYSTDHVDMGVVPALWIPLQ